MATMETSQKILDYIAKNNQASGKELVDYLGDITPRAVRKQLKNLLENGKLRKIGRPPKVFYLLSLVAADSLKIKEGVAVKIAGEKDRRIIDERYLFITPDGEMRYGWNGFKEWCEKTKQNPVKTGSEYVATLNKYDAFTKGGLIDGMGKMKNTFHKEVFLDRLFYFDFYSIERFGKTKIGQILLHSKNSQDKKLIKILVDEIRARCSFRRQLSARFSL